MLDHHPSRRAAPAARTTLALACVAAGAATLAAGVRADDRAGAVDQARSTMERWVETRRLISQEERDWTLAQDVLEQRIEVVQREIEAMRTRIAEADVETAKVDALTQEKTDANAELKTASASLGAFLRTLEDRTRALLPRIPEPLRERVRLFAQRIPEDPAATRLSISERFASVVGILNEINRANAEVAIATERRDLPGGDSADVSTIYAGLGQAWYVTADLRHAGVGTSTADGWTWRADDAAAPAIASAIAILRNEEAAGFVRLPIRID